MNATYEESQLEPTRNPTLLAQGRTSEFFALDCQRVVKLLAPERGHEVAEQESILICLARAAGLPAPTVYGLLRVDGRCGIVMERLQGQTLYDLVRRRPLALVGCVRRLAELHVAVHDKSGTHLPSQREFLRHSIRVAHLSDHLKQAALTTLEELPDGEAFCHGDLTLSNVIRARRRLGCVDWARACRGNPLADVARTAVMLRTVQWGVPPRSRPWRWLFLLGRALARQVYLHRYHTLGTYCGKELARWEIVAAAALLRSQRTFQIVDPDLQALIEERANRIGLRRSGRP
jgi:aminoglycoside phosphotransferase (APT) family kinase protein